jgi:hypothetical protein
MTTPHTIELESLDVNLQDVIEAAQDEPLVLTRHGKPVYVVRSLLDDDLADELIALNPDFIDSIERARQQKPQAKQKHLQKSAQNTPNPRADRVILLDL